MDLNYARVVLAKNLEAAMKRPGRPEISQQELARRAKRLGTEKSKLSQSTINRILKAEVSLGVDQLVILSQILDVEPWQLLVPNMDAADPPVLASVSKQLEEFQATLKTQSDRIATLQEQLKHR